MRSFWGSLVIVVVIVVAVAGRAQKRTLRFSYCYHDHQREHDHHYHYIIIIIIIITTMLVVACCISSVLGRVLLDRRSIEASTVRSNLNAFAGPFFHLMRVTFVAFVFLPKVFENRPITGKISEFVYEL